MEASLDTVSVRPQLDQLRQAGEDRLDPVRFRYLEALEHRLRTRELQHSRHWQKLLQAVREYQLKARQARLPSTPRFPPRPSSLGSLLEDLAQVPAAKATASQSAVEARVFGDAAGHGPSLTGDRNPGPRPLKAITRAHANQDAQALHERIRRAIEQAPGNAGPMNAHRVVSRAVAEMHTLSPDYMKRFARYTDTLMALEKLGKKSG